MLGDVQPGRLGHHVVLPRVGGDVEAVLDGGAAQLEQVVAEGVPGGTLGLGDGEGHQAPGAVPAPPGRVLGVGQPGALHRGLEGPQPGRGGPEDGVAPVALAGEQALGPQAAQARAHLVGGQAAGLGDRVELLGHDGAVVVGHAEHEHPGGDLDVGGRIRDGRSGHDRSGRLVTTATVHEPGSGQLGVDVRIPMQRCPISDGEVGTCRAGRTRSCRARPTDPSGGRRGRWAARVQGMQPIDR